MTLIEILVALAITLIMMAAVVNLFGVVGETVNNSRSNIEVSERLRQARIRLQLDLAGATARMLPPLRPEDEWGYLEYVEGPLNDASTVSAVPPGDTRLGDVDDVLMFTTRSSAEPFVGKSPTGILESQVAEVIWYVRMDYTVTPPQGTLYRRAMLVVTPKSGVLGLVSTSPTSDFFTKYDISARVGPDPKKMLANSLGDLTKRENRYGHDTSAFPFAINPNPPAPLAGARFGEDVILTNVVAFDVKAFDPYAQVHVAPDKTSPLVPSDPAYKANLSTLTTGAYVDLNYAPGPQTSNFSGAPSVKSGLALPTWDSWSSHYAYGGLGFQVNGDTSGNSDDVGLSSYSAPYPYPLRSLQVKIRVYEPDSKQVREVTVVQDFLTN